MFARILLPITSMLAGIGFSGALHADGSGPEYIVAPKALPNPQQPYTVLTMAPNGSWGVMTSKLIGEAITGAINDCEAMSGRKIGCGSTMKAIQSGWIVGVRCGGTNILAAAKLLANAELAAFNRENELRKVYRKDLPPCARVVTVEPEGLAMASNGPTH